MLILKKQIIFSLKKLQLRKIFIFGYSLNYFILVKYLGFEIMNNLNYA